MKRRAVVVAVLAAALLASACGTRVSSETQALGNGGVGGGGGRGSGGGPNGPGPNGPGGPGQGGGTGTGARMFGTLESPCGPGDGKPLPASDQGVTASEIRVATIADPGGARPGLNQGVFDTMEAFADWCNAQGGINGRKLVVTLRDAKLTQYKERVVEACAEDFALVGGIGVLDNLGAQDAVDCGIPNIPAAAVNPEVTASDLVFQPMPNPPNTYQVGTARWLVQNHPDAVRKAAALRTKLPITEAQSARLVEGYEQVGFDFIYEQTSNLSETNWGPLVLAMKDKGVEYVTLTSSFEEIIPLQKAMADQDFTPEVVELEANFYNQKYPEQAGEVANGTLVRLTTWPIEEADQNPAMAEYLRQLKETKGDDVQPELLGIQGWSAALMFATAVKSLGPDVTRARLETALKDIHQWDAGGMHGTSDPGAGVPSTCFMLMKVQDGGFVREYPQPERDKEIYDAGKGWSCPPRDQGLVKLTKDYGGQGAKRKG